MRRIVGSNLLNGPIRLFPVLVGAPQVLHHKSSYILSCLWDGGYNRPLAIDDMNDESGFPLSLSE